jgi:diguanylate cyclase (GGDEF)-like protein
VDALLKDDHGKRPAAGDRAATGAMFRILDGERARALLQLRRQVRAVGARSRLRQLLVLVAEMLHAKAALVGERAGRWAPIVESAPTPVLPERDDAAWFGFSMVAARQDRSARTFRCRGVDWTLVDVPRRGKSRLILLLEGDWTQSERHLVRFAASLTERESSGHAASRVMVALAGHRLARTLTRVSGRRAVCEALLRSTVRAVPSRVGAVAVAAADHLVILATHGYPRALVEHVRIRPGEGVFGTVFETRAAMLVEDVAAVPGLHAPRMRYRTKAFLAVPIAAGGEVLGVLSIADRADGGVYTAEDLAIVQGLVTPAALALARERQRRQAREYARAATVDPVSGLYNRRYFQTRLDQELHRMRRTGAPLALLMIDIDNFKHVNDEFGHVAGDALIADIGEILRRSVRVFDVCARFGGEEFLVLLPGSSARNAASTAERIRERIERHRCRPTLWPGLRVTASVGLAVANAGTTAHELIERADRALYAAKHAGKNRVQLHD